MKNKNFMVNMDGKVMFLIILLKDFFQPGCEVVTMGGRVFGDGDEQSKTPISVLLPAANYLTCK